ncbi:hypothetical protein BASA83_005353 [Batrachochytrium salamandrivorans]|nr:hypothetical protein BASA83_005353 [Batrachochytrium salamandrivorans]
MGVRGTEVVLAPSGEMGSFTQMPPTSLLCSHQTSNINSQQCSKSDPNFSDPSTSIFALSLLYENYTPPAPFDWAHHLMLVPSFVDCGADDVFMDLKLAEETKVPSQTLKSLMLTFS